VRRVFFDSNVFLYATGTDHPLRDACRELFEHVQQGALRAETSVEALQEVAHVRARRSGRRTDAVELARRAARTCVVHPVELEDLERALSAFAADESLPMRDALHAAVALNRGVTVIASADTDFDRVPGLERVDPLDREAVAALAGAG